LLLAAQRWCWPSLLDTWSVIRVRSVRRPLSKQNKVSILCFNWLNTILAVSRQQLSEMADGEGNGDGQ
jgi:hypothetical protein